MTMSHAAVTQKTGKTDSITEFNGGINLDLNKHSSMTMEVFVLNKNMSVFFSLVPKIYYILPWRFRLVPLQMKGSEWQATEEDDSCEEEDEIEE